MKTNFNNELKEFYNQNKSKPADRIAYLFIQQMLREGKIKQK